jgi:hypothetical protein
MTKLTVAFPNFAKAPKKGFQFNHKLQHWNMNDHSMTAPLPVLSPSSIFPPLSSHFVFISARKKSGGFKNVIYVFPFLKFRMSEIAQPEIA